MPSLIQNLLATLVAAAGATASAEVPLTIVIEQIPQAQGQVLIALYDNAEGWESDQAIANRAVAVSGDHVEVRFDGLLAGSYGVKLFHDLNGNGELDMNFMGIPTEPFAFSNNARGNFGPARWTDAQFSLGAEAEIQRIRLD